MNSESGASKHLIGWVAIEKDGRLTCGRRIAQPGHHVSAVWQVGDPVLPPHHFELTGTGIAASNLGRQVYIRIGGASARATHPKSHCRVMRGLRFPLGVRKLSSLRRPCRLPLFFRILEFSAPRRPREFREPLAKLRQLAEIKQNGLIMFVGRASRS